MGEVSWQRQPKEINQSVRRKRRGRSRVLVSDDRIKQKNVSPETPHTRAVLSQSARASCAGHRAQSPLLEFSPKSGAPLSPWSGCAKLWDGKAFCFWGVGGAGVGRAARRPPEPSSVRGTVSLCRKSVSATFLPAPLFLGGREAGRGRLMSARCPACRWLGAIWPAAHTKEMDPPGVSLLVSRVCFPGAADSQPPAPPASTDGPAFCARPGSPGAM